MLACGERAAPLSIDEMSHSFMSEEQAKEVCRSKLFISSDDLDPKRVTQLLGVEADDEWRKGERTLAFDKEGKRDPRRPTKFVHRRGGWRRAIDKDKEDLDVSAQLAYWCELLKSREAAVRTLQAQGCKMNIDFYIAEGPVAYIRVPPASLRDLGHLEIELSFGVYDWNELARE